MRKWLMGFDASTDVENVYEFKRRILNPGCPPQQLRQPGALLFQLLHRALARRFVGPPAEKFGAMTEAAAADVIVAHLHHELRLERLPFAFLPLVPAARAAWCVAGEARWLDQALEFLCQRGAFRGRERGRETDVVQQSFAIVQAEEERSNDLLPRAIAEAADHAIGAAEVL